MLALLYRVTHGSDSVYLVATSREAALDQAVDLFNDDMTPPLLEYLGRVANLSLGDPDATKEDVRNGTWRLTEVIAEP